MMLRVSIVDLDTFPDWASNQIPKATRLRLRGETRKALKAIDLHSIHSSGTGRGDDEDALLIVELDISLAHKIFFTRVEYHRALKDLHRDRHIRATVWHTQDFGRDFGDPEVAVTKTLEHVKMFVSYYLAMNECGK